MLQLLDLNATLTGPLGTGRATSKEVINVLGRSFKTCVDPAIGKVAGRPQRFGHHGQGDGHG